MFSSRLAKTLPLISQARHEGSSDGRINMIGPAISTATSAVTQLSSSCTPSVAVRVKALESVPGLCVSSSSRSATSFLFLFFGFASPLNVNGLTISDCIWMPQIWDGMVQSSWVLGQVRT